MALKLYISLDMWKKIKKVHYVQTLRFLEEGKYVEDNLDNRREEWQIE